MSCLPEYRYAIYVDGELEGEALREVQEHLVGCARCRGLVVALEEEAAMLGDFLHDRPATRHATGRATGRAAVPARQRARGIAIGLAPALGVAALAVTIGGWLLERGLPVGFGWLNPLVFVGATEVLFDVVLSLRSGAPELFDLAIATGTTAAFAALATFLAGALPRRLGQGLGQGLAPLLVVLAALGSLGPAAGAHALELRHADGDVRIARGETVAETLVASGDRVTVDGKVDGDLIVLAERFVLAGEVTGNLFAAAGEVELRGDVRGAAHLVGERVDVEGTVARSLYAAAETLALGDDGSVGADVLLLGDRVRLEGRAGRDLAAVAEDLEIRGSVARNARTYGETLVLDREARIAGDLDLRLPEGREAQIADAASVGGELRTGVIDPSEQGGRWTDPAFYGAGFVFLVSAFLVGLALQAVAPKAFGAHVATPTDFLRCVGLGFVALVATPVFLVLCLVTVVGIPIGVIGLFVYLTSLFLSLVVVAALIGSAVWGSESESVWAFGTSLLLGLVILGVAANLPFLGGLVRFLVLLTGLGLLVTTGYEAWKEAQGARPA